MLLRLAFWTAAFIAFAPGHALSFGFDDVMREAERVARAPYRPTPAADPQLAGMSYDTYRKQRFRPEFSTWRGSGTPFELQYFPRGRGFTRAVQIHEVVGDTVLPVRVSAAAFE